MRKITAEAICGLLDILIGPTEPVADSAIDVDREENLKALIDIGNWVLGELYNAAKHKKEPYYSSSKVGERAYGAMLEWKDWLAESEDELA